MRQQTRRAGARIAIAVAAIGAGTLVSPTAAPANPPADTRQATYATAAASAGVPESILLGVSYLESRWDTNAGLPSTSGGFGPMHLTDAAFLRGQATQPPAGYEDARGDDSRPVPATTTARQDPAPAEASLQTLTVAAQLTGLSEQSLRADPAANIRGGAALLAAYQKELGGPAGAASDPADWYGAVARYSGATDADTAASFADEVFDTIRTGTARRTDDGHAVVLPEHTSLIPHRQWLDRLHLSRTTRPDGLECPIDIGCDWVPAPYQLLGDGTNMHHYGNHDLSDRPARQKIEYIVIHDTEASWATTLRLVQNPAYVSWNYSVRSVDGQVAQHVSTKDVAWHAGNWYVNAKAVGIEHEGFAAQGAWYTEAMYRTSAKLVRYLALRLNIPLDRQHIIGHDNVPGITPAYVPGMHWDPGPYWDWSHYFDLLKAPFTGTATTRSGLVTIDPDFATNQLSFTGCGGAGVSCPPHGSSALMLHTAPSPDAPLVNDPGLRPDGSPDTMGIADHGARVSAGQQYAVADVQGDWTAIWYLGQEAWFYNPASAPTAIWSTGFVATPKPGRTAVAVYGRAYPEASAYPSGVPVQAIVPLQYTLPAGQRYVVGGIVPGEYYRATTFDGSSPGDWTVIRGAMKYVQIQLGHRIMFVKLDDVQILPAAAGA